MKRKACVAGVAKEQAALIKTMSLIPLAARSDPADDELEHERDVSPGVFLMCAAHCTPGVRILRTSLRRFPLQVTMLQLTMLNCPIVAFDVPK